MEAIEVHRRRSELEILDVRESYEWEADRLDGARHLPMRAVPSHLNELPRDRTIVVVCRSGNRSGMVAEFLRANGYSAENLDGGLAAWIAAGLPITTSDGHSGASPESPSV
jgi:rhodanese-related sulfurtransferase